MTQEEEDELDAELEAAQIEAAGAGGVSPRLASILGAPERNVVRAGFDLLGGRGAKKIERRIKEADRAVKNVTEVIKVAEKLSKLFR